MLLRPIHTFAVASLLLGGISLAQAPASSPLLPPAGLTYRYWPLSLTQFVGPELPYAAISIYVDDRGSAPLYDVTLTAREGGKRVHYVNKPELAEEDKAVGDDASVVQIGFDKNGDIGKGTQYSVRFNTEKGVPVQWQFEQLTDSSEQGSGVTPLKTPTPYLLYREQGALAGAATALKIGNVTSNATVWKEIAAPPYFVPYQGALSQGVHILRISSTDTQWKGQQPPSATGTWTMTSGTGLQLGAKSSANGVVFADGVHKTEMTVAAQAGSAGWTIGKIDLGPSATKGDHMVHITFTPSLAPAAESHFDIVFGKKTKVASGNVKSSVDGAKQMLEWTLTSPDWAAGETAKATASAQ